MKEGQSLAKRPRFSTALLEIARRSNGECEQLLEELSHALREHPAARKRE